jgi:glycosyltransferase involved in cell wall biosynthesis
VAYDQSVSVLRNYFCLLFPSYHAGEGFAATIIDAYAAGLPPIATRWRSNPEVVKDGITGLLISPHSVDELVKTMQKNARDPSIIDRMRPACIQQASQFQPSSAIKPLVQNLR